MCAHGKGELRPTHLVLRDWWNHHCARRAWAVRLVRRNNERRHERAQPLLQHVAQQVQDNQPRRIVPAGKWYTSICRCQQTTDKKQAQQLQKMYTRSSRSPAAEHSIAQLLNTDEQEHNEARRPPHFEIMPSSRKRFATTRTSHGNVTRKAPRSSISRPSAPFMNGVLLSRYLRAKR